MEVLQDIFQRIKNKWLSSLRERPLITKLLAGCTAITGLLILRKIFYIAYRKYYKYPPGLVGIPVLGCMASYINLKPFSIYLGKKYPIVCSIPLGPHDTMIFINDIDLILKYSKYQQLNNRPTLLTTQLNGFLPNSFNNVNGKEWSKRRKLFQNSLLKLTDSKYMTKYVQNNIKHKIIIPAIENAIVNNKFKWNPRESITNYTFNTIFGVSFGPNNILSVDNEEYKQFQQGNKTIFSDLMPIFLTSIFSHKLFFYLLSKSGVKNAMDKQHKLVQQWINNREKIDNFESYIDAMLNNKSNIPNEIAISDIYMSFMVGTNTTTDAIEMCLFMSAKHSSIQDQIFDELCSIFGKPRAQTDNMLEIKDMKQLYQLHILRAFIEECFRYNVANGALPRGIVDTDFKLQYGDGDHDYYILPKGSGITFNTTYHFNRTDVNWYNPLNFDIKNYLDDENKFIKISPKYKKHKIFQLSQFGVGRDCPGQNLARKEILFALVCLFHRYKFHGPNGIEDTSFEVSRQYLSGFGVDEQILTVERRF